MSPITKLSALTACGTLLLSGLAVLPANAEGTGPLTLNLRYAGVESQVEVSGVATVAAAIAQLKLAVDADDRVAPSLDSPLSDRMSVVVDVVSTKTSTKKVTLKYATVKKKTKSLFKGDQKVVKKGRNGKATRTYLTTTVNGVSSTDLVKEKGIPVIFTEVNGSDATAQAIHRETGCTVAQLTMVMDGPDDQLVNYYNALLANAKAGLQPWGCRHAA